MTHITLENIEQFSVSLEEHPLKWMFEDKDSGTISQEHKDQIFALTPEAARLLWMLESQFKIFGKEFFEGKYFQDNIKWIAGNESEQKKWLYNLGIPFPHKIFIAIEPDYGFVMTWKMVIKYIDKLFWANDQTIWDKTLNWGLAYHHDGVFYFGKNRIYNADIESEKIASYNQIIKEAMEQIEKNKDVEKKKYFPNPFLN